MVAYKQDMPPAGGYAPITYERIPPKPRWNPYVKMGAVVLYTAASIYWWHKRKAIEINHQIEMKCSNLAVLPMLQAEVDRMYLKQLKKNRDAEEEVMKNVEGWELGKWQGLPIYLTLKPDEYFKPAAHQYYAHALKSDMHHSFFIFRDS